MFGDIGDAFMLVFRSARDAIRCAIGIQRAFAIRNQTAKPAVRVRIGLHTGELVHGFIRAFSLIAGFPMACLRVQPGA